MAGNNIAMLRQYGSYSVYENRAINSDQFSNNHRFQISAYVSFACYAVISLKGESEKKK